MTKRKVPSFWNSPYFVPETDNWHLKPGAPAEIVKEFNEYMGNDEEIELEIVDEA